MPGTYLTFSHENGEVKAVFWKMSAMFNRILDPYVSRAVANMETGISGLRNQNIATVKRKKMDLIQQFRSAFNPSSPSPGTEPKASVQPDVSASKKIAVEKMEKKEGEPKSAANAKVKDVAATTATPPPTTAAKAGETPNAAGDAPAKQAEALPTPKGTSFPEKTTPAKA